MLHKDVQIYREHLETHCLHADIMYIYRVFQKNIYTTVKPDFMGKLHNLQ